MKFYEIFLSLKYLKDRKRQKFISFISMMSILGVFIGVATLIVVLSIMNGFDNMLVEKFIGMDAHLSIEKIGGDFQESECDDLLQSVPAVDSWSAHLLGQAMIVNSFTARGIVVKGVNWGQELKTSSIQNYFLLAPEDCLPIKEGEIIIGKPLAQELGLSLGSSVKILSPAHFFKKKRKPLIKSFKVVNMFETFLYDFDSTHIYMNLNSFRELFLRKTQSVDRINILLHSHENLPLVQTSLKGRLKRSFLVYSWQDRNKNLFSALKLEKNVMFIILLLIIIVSVFNISSTLIMIIMEKTREIGILKALGAHSFSIALVFSLQGIIIGSLGAFLGCWGGIGICYLLKKTDWIQLPNDIYYVDHLPVLLERKDVLIIVLATIFFSWISTLYPAVFASRLNPIEALSS